MTPECFGIAGWKNSGKTSLVAGLVEEISTRGLVVSTIKHAHHTFDLDTAGTDSFKHRKAGAHEVVLVSGKRWAIQHELAERPEPDFWTMLGKLSPCDLVLVEGYKREKIPKIEIISEATINETRFWTEDPNVRALACDIEIAGCPLPCFPRNAYREIADFILEQSSINS
ncbi:MAG: molybdopterin-guanine dinucleotide biosynthesis protein B [Rhizobiaceae bacterium]|jgi:molybdopterin-guanine dinucleotide biosynthesis protein B|nr:molybdopterin-guanine dinucleotide biosynthesis protein B [Rhizobiaceae bacterium]